MPRKRNPKAYHTAVVPEAIVDEFQINIAPDVIFTPPAVQHAQIDSWSPLPAVMKDDIEHYNVILQGLQAAWKHCFSVDEVCKMALTTAKILSERRKIMLLPFEAIRKNSEEFLTPYEDDIPDQPVPQESVQQESFVPWNLADYDPEKGSGFN